jgi:hypothetical protein
MYLQPVTTETLRKKFKNNFNLCNFAITIGRSMVLSGTQYTLTEVLQAVEKRADEGYVEPTLH